MMREYGELLRNTFKNPFDDFNASLIDTEKIVEFWCEPIEKGPKELLSTPTFFSQKMPFIIQGSRGSGKTMIFKYYSYDAQKIIAKTSGNIIDHLQKIGGVGFYFRCDPPFINSLKAICSNIASEKWEDVFSYYMQMHISQNIIDMIFDLEAEGELARENIEPQIISSIQTVFSIDSIENLASLKRTIFDETLAIQKYKNLSIFLDEDILLPKRFAAKDLSEVIITAIKNSIPAFSSLSFVLMVDEYEALPAELQRSFNTMLKYSNDTVTLRIGRRTEKNIETATINETEYLRVNHDYLLIDLDEKIEIADAKKYFFNVAQKRLNLVFKDLDIDIKHILGDSEDLVNECIEVSSGRKDHIFKILKTDPSINKAQIPQIIDEISVDKNPIMEMLNALWVVRSTDGDKLFAAEKTRQAMVEYLEKKNTPAAKKYYLDYQNKYRYSLTVLLCALYKKNKLYYSFNTISHLSNGNTRLFINLCREIISDALYYETDSFFENLSVSSATQSNAIHKFSAKEFDDICSIIQYGDNVRKLILNLGNMFSEFHKDRKVRYPETNQFVLDQLELDRPAANTLNMALRWALIVKKSIPQRLSMDINKRGDIFYINRIFSPLFNISYRTRGGFNVSIAKNEFAEMCVDIYTPESVNKVRDGKKGPALPTNQISLFSGVGGDGNE